MIPAFPCLALRCGVERRRVDELFNYTVERGIANVEQLVCFRLGRQKTICRKEHLLLLISSVRAFAHEQPKELKRFVKFATVGALGSVTDFSVFNGLVFLAALEPLLANSISFCAAVVQNFALNRRWTFPESQERDPRKQLSKFALVSVVGLGINTLVFHMMTLLLEPLWHTLISSPELALVIALNFSKLFAIGVVLFWNFAVNRFWTYRGL